MCGNHPSNKGGMTSVINQILEYDWEKENIGLTFVPTFKPGNPVVKSLFFLFSYIRIILVFLFDKPNLVHAHMSYKGSFTRKYLIHRLCKVFGIKDAIHLHGSEFKKWYDSVGEKKKAKIRRLLRESDYFIVLGEKWKRIILSIEPTANVVVISNGIKIPSERVQWDNNICKYLFLGVLIPRKGVGDLLDAVAQIKKNKNINGLQFLIAGTGECEDSLKEKTDRLNLNSNVKFLGWIDGKEKENLIRSCQIMVSPSYNEGLPVSILEAMSYGMPVISTDVGDISSIVTDGDNGILFDPGDINSLANAILNLSNEETFARMSKDAESSAGKFSIDIFYNKLLKVYGELEN